MSIVTFMARRLLARQLACPSGVFGRHVMGRLLNRTTTAHNALVLAELEVSAADRVLEVGFGGAALLEGIVQQAREGFVAGVELSAEMVAAAGARLRSSIAAGRVELRQGSVESLPYPDASFDKACSVNTVYFWPGLAAGLKEFSRVIRPGGRLVLGFVSDRDLRRAGLDRRGFTVYSPDELAAALVQHGFRPGALKSGVDARGAFLAVPAERAE